MVMEANLDNIDAEIWKDAERKEAIIEEFRSRRTARLASSTSHEFEYQEGYKIEKTKKRYSYESTVNKYPEGENFKMTKE